MEGAPQGAIFDWHTFQRVGTDILDADWRMIAETEIAGEVQALRYEYLMISSG